MSEKINFSSNANDSQQGRRVLVFGGRDFHDADAMEKALRRHLQANDVVVHGGARGADALAGDIAGRVMGHEVEVHPADWHKHGKSAGPIRNQEMLDSGVDYAIGLPGGRGSADMAGRLKKAGVPLVEVTPWTPPAFDPNQYGTLS